MRFLKKKGKKLASLVAASALLFGAIQPNFVLAADENSTASDTQNSSGGNILSGMMNNPAALSMLMMSGIGGIPIPGSTAKYIPIPGQKTKTTPFCYIYPTHPEKGQTVTAVCAVRPPAGVKVKQTSPLSLAGMINKGMSPVIIQQVTVDDDKSQLSFQWELEKTVITTDANGKEQKKTETDTAMAMLTIAAYEGNSGLSNDNGVSDSPGGGVLYGGTTKECNSDNTLCYITTCPEGGGDCTTTCEGSACPTNTTDSSDKCPIGYSYSSGSCVLNSLSDCDSGYARDDSGTCVKTPTSTSCTDVNGESVCQDCLGDVCVPYSPSSCVTATLCTTTDGGSSGTSDGGGYTYPTDNGGTYDSGSSSLDDAANDALNNLFGDDDSSYNAPDGGSWLDPDDTTGDADTLDGYLGDGAEDAVGDGAEDGMTTDDGYYTDPGADGEDGSDGADGDSVVYNGSDGSDGSSGSNGSNGADGSLGSLLGRYQDGTSGLDALLNGDNSELLGKIDGKNSSLSDKIGALLGLGNDTNPAPTKSNNELYDIARQTLLANGMTMDDIMHGRNYDANSAFTEPKTSWDMNRITTLINSKKLKVDSKGNAVESASASKDGKSSAATSSSSSGDKQAASSSSSSSGAKNASLTKK